MTREEAIKFLALIKVAYPTAFKDMDKESKLATVNMWQNTFPNIPFRIMEFAFDHFRRVSTYPPTVAEMFKELNQLYYRALGDEMMAAQDGNEALAKRASWVMTYTSQFRGDSVPLRIGYGSISDDELQMLPEGEPSKRLLKRGD